LKSKLFLLISNSNCGRWVRDRHREKLNLIINGFDLKKPQEEKNG
jgi:hypothetical protein